MKKYICLLLFAFAVCSMAGCSANMYEDTNGAEDFSLQILTDEDILRDTGVARVMSSTTTFNGKTVCETKTMSGVLALYEDRLRGEDFRIVVSSEFTKGNARLVLVLNDEIVHEFALHGEDQVFMLKDVTGDISLKVAGESTGFRITYRFP